ncbi:MYCBP-associated protein [Engraulis encrasicolus]|uniref:MYCBP-associated protein n=1 Tax=Engraulis encrasicolus TaxID=184585 RepID=UPI002FD07D4E
MASLKVSRKDTRPRSPPDRKRAKASEDLNSILSEEATQSPALKPDDIQALTIRHEDLEKLRVPKPPKDTQKPAAMTRVLVRKSRPSDQTRKGIPISVARPLPQTCAVQPLQYTGPGGPRFDPQGMILPHSILGNLEDFKRDMEARGEMELASRVPVPQSNLSQLAEEQRGGPESRSHPDNRDEDFQSHALQHWDDCMSERRRQQDFISRLLQRPVEQLVMNQSNQYRQTQEQRGLISRGLPALHPGHGNRVGSEFWSLPQHYGDRLSGITATLTQTERGNPPPVSHIAQPHTIRLQSGNVHPESSVGCAWDSSLYLQHRREELKHVLRELDFNQPVRHKCTCMHKHKQQSLLPDTNACTHKDKKTHIAPQQGNTFVFTWMDPLSRYDDVLLDAVLVPALRFCGEAAEWTGNAFSHKDEVGISACVTFEALSGESANSHIELENYGSTALYYSWQKIPHTPRFPEARANNTRMQSFYFNTTMGVILPGEKQRVALTFKGSRVGILSEVWRLHTHPVLLGGAALQLTLRGVSIYQDTTAPHREALQMEIQHREALSVCVSVVNDLLRGIRSPERPSSPAHIYTTEEEHFTSMNPQLHYHYKTVEALKTLWKEVTSSSPMPRDISKEVTSSLSPSSSSSSSSSSSVHCDITSPDSQGPAWDLCVSSLRKAVLCLPKRDAMEVGVVEGTLHRSEALARLNTLVVELQHPQTPPPPLDPHTITRQLLREVVDGLCMEAVALRQSLGMPEMKTPHTGDSQLQLQDEACMAGVKIKKEEKSEKKGMPSPKDDKKGAAGKDKEDKKGTPRATPSKDKDKEDRSGSRKKPIGGKAGKEAGSEPPSVNGTSPEQEEAEQHVECVDPRLKDKYRRLLHHQVYVRVKCMLMTLWDIMEDSPPPEQHRD